MSALLPVLRGRAAVAVLALASLAVVFAGGPMGGAALRGGAVLSLLAAGHFAIRRMRARGPGAAGPELVVSERCALGRDAGLALVRVGGRQLVVGWAPSGVSLVTELADNGDAAR